MINILAEVQIEDFSKFLEMFSSKGLEARRKFGCVKSRVYKIEDDEKRIYILFKWTSKEDFTNFVNDAGVKETMKSSGTTAPPKFTFLEKAAKLDG